MLKKKILYEPWHLLSIIILGKDIIFHALAFIEYHYIRKFLVHINVDAQMISKKSKSIIAKLQTILALKIIKHHLDVA